MRDKIKISNLIMRLIVLLFGVYLFSIFVTPISVGIRNVGNLTGIAVAIVLIGVVLLWNQVKKVLSFLWEKKVAKRILVILSFLVGLVIVGAIGITILLYRGAVVDSLFMRSEEGGAGKSAHVLLVLGCQVRGTSPSLMLRERLDAAYEYMVDHPDAVCIVSGGQGPGESIPEAECMYDYLVKKGIDGSRIYQEDKSTTTAENLTFSKEIMEREGLGKTVAMVTNEFHEYRARRLAYKYGLESIPVSAKTAGWLFPTYYVRELYAVPGYFLKY
ncbi:MAG: YdcF family protein [Eubacterium sp.]|nr:YdcF family protein [Eubacterium sp.]